MSVVHSISKAAVLAAIPTAMPKRFRPEAAGDLDATFELRVSGTRFAIRVADGSCRVERRPAPEAKANMTVSAGDIVRMITGSVEWPVLLAANRLELGGDPFLGLRFPQLFGISTRAP